jgi:nucleotide-binding universal stress UspA family protein
MFKSLLVHIPSERTVRPAVDGSISLASACGAHLDALAIGYEPTNIPLAAAGGAAVAAVFEQERQRALERAEAALTIFKAEAKDAGISYNCRAIDAIPAEAISIAAGTARLHDLTIVSQPEGDGDTFDNELPQQILFEAGSPVLFIPYTFRGTFAAKRVGICWDGSRLASRALRDAMPFLRQADALTIITIGKSDTIPAEVTPKHLLLYLARAGLSARTISFPAGHSEIQPAILSVAADESLDFLVMGGYEHSRIQETVMGGVTREMIRSMTLPTLMSH